MAIRVMTKEEANTSNNLAEATININEMKVGFNREIL